MMLGEWFRKARLTNGLTLRKVSADTGIFYVNLSNFELCKTKEPSIWNVIRLCNYYNVKLEEVLKVVEIPEINLKYNYPYLPGEYPKTKQWPINTIEGGGGTGLLYGTKP